MSIDSLQDKIRKTKNPSVLELSVPFAQLPPAYCDLDPVTGSVRYCADLLDALKGKIPAVRFGFSSFAVMGAQALDQLSALMKQSSELGYYVLLEAPQMMSASAAEAVAQAVFGAQSNYPCDGLIVPGYFGSDIWKPLLPYCKDAKKDIFVVARTGNKSASELQDLLAGARLVHVAAADHVNRYGGDCVGKCGYSRVGVMAAATSADSLRMLRSRYSRLFLLIDGYDYPSANAKNCACAFDRLGYGAAVCAGNSISCAWSAAGSDGADCLEQAVAAADRMKKNLSRYVTVL